MNPVSGVVLYVVLWFLALFIVLPIGIRPVADADPSSGWRGAPERPMLLKKAVGTTVLAAVLWGLVYLVATSDYLSFRSGILAPGTYSVR